MEELQAPAPDQSIRKMLNKMFNQYNYVGVRNPLEKDFVWAVALTQNEIVGMSQADPMNEDSMARGVGGTFLPGDSVTRTNQKITRVVLAAGERKMIPGEAAYVVVPRLFNALVREKYGTDKSSLAKLRNPTIQAELIKDIVVGPIINNVGEAIETFVNKELQKIEGFTDVQTQPSETVNDNKTTATRQPRRANQAA